MTSHPDGSSGLSFPTSLGTSTADEIRLPGQDLTADLMGKVSFGELAFWLVALRRPTASETPSCCAASPCWPGRPGRPGRSPRSAAARSAWTCT